MVEEAPSRPILQACPLSLWFRANRNSPQQSELKWLGAFISSSVFPQLQDAAPCVPNCILAEETSEEEGQGRGAWVVLLPPWGSHKPFHRQISLCNKVVEGFVVLRVENWQRVTR
ncbi:hypothetical protein Adt_27506 [Abeliophyllum distichum]|uniref:Uncharacterized protein n=1 Tax=Abeliophyllum distichum TaxID=126358 RepID=A0ABD1RU83_9LAMI